MQIFGVQRVGIPKPCVVQTPTVLNCIKNGLSQGRKSKALFMNPIKKRKVLREENQVFYSDMSLASIVGHRKSESGW